MPYELFGFAYFPYFDSVIESLAERIAENESWDFGNPQVKSYTILKNYLDHTFRKLRTEGKIAYTSDNQHSCFNTGLVTRNQEDIFAFFEGYRNPRPGSTFKYCFKAFLKKSDSLLLQYFSNSIPDVANYFNNPELLIYNPKYELIPDLDHIINDNEARFPSHMLSVGQDEIRRQLIGAIDYTKKRVRNNYTLAVPQYFNEKIQLLLPLFFTEGSPNPDLAIVVYKVANGNSYCARTCLTIKMAYNNARLIVKPQSNWLKP